MPFDQHPTLLGLPYFKMPGISRGLSPEQCSEQDAFAGPWIYIEPFVYGPEPKPMWPEMRLNHLFFIRMIAKIAHEFAIWSCGINNVQPFLTDIILGKDLSRTFYYCGGEPSQVKLSKDDHHLHLEIGRGVHIKLKPDEGYNNIVVTVRLFADIGAPVYFAVVGKELNN